MACICIIKICFSTSPTVSIVGKRIVISPNSYINPTVETVGYGLYLYYQNMFFNIAHGFNRGETNCDFS